ncbi:hypothetical protein LC608_27915 [Nostoc sp. XA010]|uniref:hypothetical protein n=1 Tax=Nostoc sp. XA010 TaxID=2780407 RepID=UPI001E44F165|nr:hypothetical protein [Nostoc sp. XA010]MCC5660734.1 hypothetical protein [Nostoc sp. XA010]
MFSLRFYGSLWQQVSISQRITETSATLKTYAGGPQDMVASDGVLDKKEKVAIALTGHTEGKKTHVEKRGIQARTLCITFNASLLLSKSKKQKAFMFYLEGDLDPLGLRTQI